MTNKEKVEEVLRQKINVVRLEIEDDSHKHAGHNPLAKSGGTHMNLLIISDDFKGKKAVERHKMIYKILENELKAGLHALAIKALTKKEAHSS